MIVVLDVVTRLKVPGPAAFEGWVAAAGFPSESSELSIRIVDEAESQALNETYRQKSGPTNVLSFPCELPAGVPQTLLGDLVLCAPLVEREAAQQGKAVEAHWAHLVIHGLLHLRGFDHENEADAMVMESLEIEILARLGLPNPYLEEDETP